MAIEGQNQEYQNLASQAEAKNGQMDQALKNVINEINELSDITDLNDSINFNQILSANVLDKFNKIPETQRNAINSEINRLKEQYANDPGISKQLNTLSILFEAPTSNTATGAASFDTFSRLVKLQATNRLRDNITNSERRDIKQFIEEDNNKNTVLDTYLSMLPIVPRENMAEGTSWRDRSVINDIKDWIEEKYNKNGEIGLRELDNKIFTGVEIFADYIKNNPTWDGSTAPTEAYIQEKCSGAHAYTADQFKAKFAEKNAARITTNNEKFGTITMENKYNKDIIKKIKGEDNTYTLELTKDDGNTVTATVNDFIENLGIQIDAPEGTAFTNNERQAAINSKKQNWFDDIVNNVEDKLTAPAQPETQAITEFTTENFDSNLKLFNRVTKEDIVAAIDDAKGKLDGYESADDKTKHTERINEVIAALKDGGEALSRSRKPGHENIKKLQEKMNSELDLSRPLIPDGKLGKYTFFVMKNYMGLSATQGETILYERGGSLSGRQQQIAALIGQEGNEDALRELGVEAVDGENINQVALGLLDKSRLGYLKDYLKNYRKEPFPGRDKIETMLGTEDKEERQQLLQELQLALIPYYTGHIDGLMGPRTLTAIENYSTATKKNLSDPDEAASLKAEEITLPSNQEEKVNRVDDNTILTKNRAYFRDSETNTWKDFMYTKTTKPDGSDGTITTLTATVDGTKYTTTDGGSTLTPENDTIKGYFATILANQKTDW